MYRLLFEDRAGSRAPFVSNRTTVVIGRDAACELRLADNGIRDRHAAVERRADGYYIRDLAQASGVRINGQVAAEQRLATGDELELGAVRLRFEIVHDPPPGRRAFDPWLLVAVVIVTGLVGAQFALFSWIFRSPHPRNMRTDVGRTPLPGQQSQPDSLATPPSLLPLEAGQPAASATPAPAPEVLNHMLKIVRVDRLDAADSVTLKISVKAQVGERQLDASAAAVGVQFFGPPAKAREVAWLTVPRDWGNFSTKLFTARFTGPPAQCSGYVVRTYYRKQLQDVAAAPAFAPVTEVPSAP